MNEIGHGEQYIGRGIYGISEAARLLRRPRAQVARWANGYTYERTHDMGKIAPVLQTDRGDKRAITFHELIELFFVREYTNVGIRLGHIRDTATAMAAEYGPFPFATKKLLTDGRRLVAVSEKGLISPATCQLIADFAHEFVHEVTFEDDFVRLWMPKEGDRAVVVDPTRAFGEPILAVTGTPTRAIYRAYLREQDFGRVAAWYDISDLLVKVAVEFESRFSNAA
jgi:uncharacterized protein (DUF433 family)